MAQYSDRLNFSRQISRRTHIAFHRKTPVVELSFSSETNLLAEALFSTREQNQSPVRLTYAEYRLFDGLPLPTRVTRQVGDAGVWTFTIQSVDFAPVFTDEDFIFQEKGGAR